MAVKLGYKNVYRDPLGFGACKEQCRAVVSSPAEGSESAAAAGTPGPLSGWAMVWSLLGVFVGGMALNLTPCVYPLIPITVSFFCGKSCDIQGSLHWHGLLYVVGLAVTNSTLGVAAALTGSLMGSLLQTPLVLIAVAAILVFFATSLFGFWELRLPASVTKVSSQYFAGYFGSLFMGLTIGLLAAPCIGPFMLGLLAWVASMGSPWLGFLVFFTLSLGLGLPLFFLAMFSGNLEKLPRSGEWMLWVRKLMGWVLIGMAAYFIRPLLPESVGILLLAAVALAAAVHLEWIDRTTATFRGFQWFKTTAALVGVIIATFLVGSWALRGPGVNWKPYSEQLLAEAKHEQKPVIIDFFATWCTPCRVLEENTFHNPDVVKKANQDFVMLRVNLTQKGNPVYERLLGQYDIKGVPTVLFLDGQGKELKDLRLADFLPPEQMLSRMAAATRK